ncbi:RagB/SusD family nutrient uptake outer membrane protein [Echinicola shivajiensis]|uniref:RagB/SusD family nutrient uptake outer membrane protein n=1 Tax=Echinicola shivajiensis TaxID=1035916 RepID=UPI001BFC3DD7|nr:RagB/SusD family nutrient uptake outer membrane protein [Echinicola shivajiensis]
MKKMHKYIGVCLLALSMSACQNYLDRPVVSDVDEERVFTDYKLTYQFVNDLYSYRIDEYRGANTNGAVGTSSFLGAGMLASATDDSKYSELSSPINFLNSGNWTPSYNPANIWSDMYSAVRKANLFFENVDRMVLESYDEPIRDNSELDANGNLITAGQLKTRLTGEVYFLRAYYYYELIKRYGGVPIIDQTYELGEEVNSTRASFEACVNFILDDLESARPLLPVNYNYYAANKGRATQPMVDAFKAQVLMLAASPLHNTSNDLDKWQAAADAYKEVIESGAYSLNNNYDRAFVRNQGSPESIFEIIYYNRSDVERNNTPVGYEGGGGGINPTQDLVEAYEMADGTAFDWNNPAHAAAPFDNRDPRFYLSILYNGADWRGRPVESYVGGLDGEGVNGATLTGYYMRKFMDPELDILRDQTSTKNWVILRYAEILLGYAEAQNEAVGPDASVYEAINEVRDRAGMPALPEGLSQDEMRAKIRHERRIEFAFEGQRFFDTRRWKTAEDEFNGPVHGLRITQSGDDFEYDVIEVEDRIFTEKMYLFPIPQSEINNTNGNLQQNPMW